jgi:hypothetical protein
MPYLGPQVPDEVGRSLRVGVDAERAHQCRGSRHCVGIVTRQSGLGSVPEARRPSSHKPVM